MLEIFHFDFLSLEYFTPIVVEVKEVDSSNRRREKGGGDLGKNGKGKHGKTINFKKTFICQLKIKHLFAQALENKFLMNVHFT